jgi:hypothetical protein
MRALRERSQSFTASSFHGFHSKSWMGRKADKEHASPRSRGALAAANNARSTSVPDTFGAYSDAMKLVEQVMELAKNAGLGVDDDQWTKVRSFLCARRNNILFLYFDHDDDINSFILVSANRMMHHMPCLA